MTRAKFVVTTTYELDLEDYYFYGDDSGQLFEDAKEFYTNDPVMLVLDADANKDEPTVSVSFNVKCELVNKN